MTTNGTELSLKSLLVVEDNERIPAILCPSTPIPLWTTVRNRFLRMILSDVLYTTEIEQPVPQASRQAAIMLVRYGLHNVKTLRGNRHAPICVMGSGAGLQKANGQWFNRLSDHFVSARPHDTVLIEDHNSWQWPFPRATRRMVFHAPLQAEITINGKLRVREAHRQQAEALLDLVCDRARRLLGWKIDNARRAQLVEQAAQKSAAMPHAIALYRRMFKRLGTRLLLKESGCYGPSAPVIAAARDLGIVTAEYAHGAVFEGHDAYNFAPAISASPVYRACLPDFFLSYGDWWNKQLGAPLSLRSVGYPHREEQLARRGETIAKTQILVLGDGIDTNLTLDFAGRLAERCAPYQVLFRPHPLERRRIRPDAGQAKGFGVDTEPDLYRSFETAVGVVGEHSTAIFEAAGVTERIFVWDTPKSRLNIPHHPFTPVDGPEELAARILSGENGRLSTQDIQSIWASDWRKNYDNFLSEVIK